MKVVIDDFRLERMDVYTDPLNDKIKRQAAEITRLLAENAELKKDLEYYHTGTDTCDIESARATGQQEAWKLARKCMLMTDREREAIFGSGHNALYGILTYFDYKHAAAKVAAWEKTKEEICVWDEVELINGVRFFVTYSCNGIVNGVSASGQFFEGRLVQECKKTGRHIDVQKWLAQIGGGSNETEN